MDGVPAVFSGGWMLRLLRSLVALFSWSVFFGCLGFLEVYCSHLLFSILCNMSHANQKVNLPILNLNHRHLTVYCTNVRGLKGNFTDLEVFLLKNNLCIFALCETMATSRTLISNCLASCHSIARMLGMCTTLVFKVRSIFRLPERLFLRMKASLTCVFIWFFNILLPSYFSSIVHHLHHLVLWLRLCHPI